jgi:hypothetical protein
MREIFVVGSYCDTASKIEALENLLHQAKSLGIQTLVFGKYPLPEKTQRLCDYFLFDKDNPFIAGRAICYWHTNHGFRVSDIFPDHGLAALSQITKGLSVAKALNYDIAYWVNYDVDLANFADFSSAAKLSLSQGSHAAGFEFTKMAPLAAGICLTSIAFKLNPASEKLNGILTESLYRRVIESNSSFYAEDVMLEAVKLSELKYDFLDPALNFPASITVMGDRLNGKFDSGKLPISTKYFSNFFIGFDENSGSPGFFIWNTYPPNLEIEIDFGNSIGTFTNGNSVYIHETLADPPSQCKILSINGEPVNETLDESFSNEYWGRHRIRQESE